MSAAPEPVPFCGPAPLPASLAAAWNLTPGLVLAFAALAVALAALTRRGAGSGGAAAGAGLVLAILLVSPLCALSVALFSVRSVHHLGLVVIAAPLLALAVPRGRAAAPGTLLAAAAVQALVFWLWHAPAAYAAAMSDDAVYIAMEVSLLASATWFWRLALAPRGDPLAVVGALAGTSIQMGLLGALLTFAPRPLYEAHLTTTLPFGLAPLADQQLAGLLMWVGTMPVYAGVALALIGRRLRAGPADAGAAGALPSR